MSNHCHNLIDDEDAYGYLKWMRNQYGHGLYPWLAYKVQNQEFDFIVTGINQMLDRYYELKNTNSSERRDVVRMLAYLERYLLVALVSWDSEYDLDAINKKYAAFEKEANPAEERCGTYTVDLPNGKTERRWIRDNSPYIKEEIKL